MPTNLMIASRQWASRPPDQRFHSLAELFSAVANRRLRSRQADRSLIDIEAEVLSVTPDTSTIVIARKGANRKVEPSNWAFGQLAAAVSAPAQYLRTLPPALTVQAINFGIKQAAQSKGQMKFMTVDPEIDGGMTTLQALNSVKYGRIWDADVVQAAMSVVEASNGAFYNPKAYSPATGQPEPSGLYASDHDVFIFMIDGGSVLDVGPRAQLNRGFILWNSETGARTMGWMTFLFNVICGNHIIWGASDIKEGRIIHRGSAPARFQSEALPALLEYVHAPVGEEEAVIRKAQDYLLPADEDALIAWLKARKFTGSQAEAAIEYARKEEGDARTLWQIVQGATASAREMAFIDARIELETIAGSLLDIVKGI